MWHWRKYDKFNFQWVVMTSKPWIPVQQTNLIRKEQTLQRTFCHACRNESFCFCTCGRVYHFMTCVAHIIILGIHYHQLWCPPFTIILPTTHFETIFKYEYMYLIIIHIIFWKCYKANIANPNHYIIIIKSTWSLLQVIIQIQNQGKKAGPVIAVW